MASLAWYGMCSKPPKRSGYCSTTPGRGATRRAGATAGLRLAASTLQLWGKGPHSSDHPRERGRAGSLYGLPGRVHRQRLRTEPTEGVADFRVQTSRSFAEWITWNGNRRPSGRSISLVSRGWIPSTSGNGDRDGRKLPPPPQAPPARRRQPNAAALLCTLYVGGLRDWNNGGWLRITSGGKGWYGLQLRGRPFTKPCNNPAGPSANRRVQPDMLPAPSTGRGGRCVGSGDRI